MSYLGFPRLHFAGRFQTDPSTVNNDPYHFNDATFTADDQLPGPGASNGWWNPQGSANWRLVDCTVRSVWYGDGSLGDDPNTDPIIGMAFSQTATQVSGKLVDLDTEQQMVSEIWGFQIQLGQPGQPDSVQGNFEVAPFADIWVRYAQGQPDSFFSAFYQSILSSIQWPEVINSRFLQECQIGGAYPTKLSIKFIVDGYDDDRTSPTFTLGRIVGTIGPFNEGEPQHFVAGRLLRPVGDNSPLNDAPCCLDETRRMVLVDLANSLPTTAVGGPLQELGQLQLALLPTDQAPVLIGSVPYQTAGWYENRAGIQTFALNEAQFALAQKTPLALVLVVAGQVSQIYLAENEYGTFARADKYVFRLNPGDCATTQLYATRFGQPWPQQQFDLSFDNDSVIGQVKQGAMAGPPAGQPESALTFPPTIQTDARGIAQIELQGHNPGNPRQYIDGQVYGVRYDWHGLAKDKLNAPDPGNNPAYLLNTLVWDAYTYDAPPTWLDNVQPIFQQYANLYPVMKRIVDLSDYQSVVNRGDALQLAFSRNVADPNYMPVTRDLSQAKLAMLQTWLGSPLYTKIPDIDHLKQALQLAIKLEHATIPPYLCALYSIKPGFNQEAAEIIRSVVLEEMLHMSLACNLLNAIGGSPDINVPDFVPTYPGPLPGGLRPELTVSLKKCSLDHIRTVFMSIEEPDETIYPEKYEDLLTHHNLTIGWFYNLISAAFDHLSEHGTKNIFVGDPARQIRGWGGVGTMIPVTDLLTAQAAIREIVEQGEGASPFNPEDGYNELAHFYKFEEIVRGRRIEVFEGGYDFTGPPIPFDPAGVYPMIDNPDTNSLPLGSRARRLSEGFNQTYANLLSALHQTFNGQPEQLPAAVGLMFSINVQAQELMQTPIAAGSSVTAGPSFQIG